jgi:hypothetical protein
MESFYSILYYKPNPLTDEMLLLGFFGGGGEGPFIYLSENRFKLLQSSIHRNSFLALRRNLIALEKSINQYRNDERSLLLFDSNYSVSIFEKLHKKSKGALVFTSPTIVNGWMTRELFNDLVLAFVGENAETKVKRKVKPFHIKWRSYKKAARFKHLQRDISLEDIYKGAGEIPIDLYDNDNRIVYKAIDFDVNKQSYSLKYRDLMKIAQQTNLQLVLICPTPKTKLGKERADELKHNFPHVQQKGMEEIPY